MEYNDVGTPGAVLRVLSAEQSLRRENSFPQLKRVRGCGAALLSPESSYFRVAGGKEY